jgi:hypothetical protein
MLLHSVAPICGFLGYLCRCTESRKTFFNSRHHVTHKKAQVHMDLNDGAFVLLFWFIYG